MVKLTTGQCMRLYRKRSGLKMDYIARKAGVTGRAILYWEKDERVPNIFEFYNMTKVYNVSVEQLMGIEPPNLEEDELEWIVR